MNERCACISTGDAMTIRGMRSRSASHLMSLSGIANTSAGKRASAPWCKCKVVGSVSGGATLAPKAWTWWRTRAATVARRSAAAGEPVAAAVGRPVTELAIKRRPPTIKRRPSTIKRRPSTTRTERLAPIALRSERAGRGTIAVPPTRRAARATAHAALQVIAQRWQLGAKRELEHARLQQVASTSWCSGRLESLRGLDERGSQGGGEVEDQLQREVSGEWEGGSRGGGRVKCG